MNTGSLIAGAVSLRTALLCAALAAVPAAAVAATGASAAAASAVTDPLAREALAVRRVDKAVLLGAALAGKRVVAVGERGIVALSDDGGRTWRQAKRVPTSLTLTIVKFVTATAGWAAGHGGAILKTTDGGETWAMQFDGVRAAQALLRQAQSQQQRGTPEAAALLRKAQRLVQDGADKPFLDLDAADERHAIVAGAGGLLFATADGGATWTPWGDRLDNPQGLNLYAVRRAGSDIVVAGEQGLVLHSGDAGATFTRIAAPYEGSWFTLAFQGPGAFIVAGLRGNAWRVRLHVKDGGKDGGKDREKGWTRIAGIAPLSFTAAVPVDASCTLLANQGGQLLAVGKGVDRAVPVATEPLPPITATLRRTDGGWLVFTMEGIFQRQLQQACPRAAFAER